MKTNLRDAKHPQLNPTIPIPRFINVYLLKDYFSNQKTRRMRTIQRPTYSVFLLIKLPKRRPCPFISPALDILLTCP
jgi:hypothetical protein